MVVSAVGRKVEDTLFGFVVARTVPARSTPNLRTRNLDAALPVFWLAFGTLTFWVSIVFIILGLQS